MKSAAILSSAIVIVAFTVAALFLAARASAADDIAAQKTLQAAQLTRLSSGVWVLPAEQRLREKHQTLFKLKTQLPSLEKDIVARIDRNRALYSQRRAAEDALKKPGLDGAQRETLRASIAALKTQCVEPRQLANLPEVRDAVVGYAAARNELTLLVTTLRQAIAGLETGYRPLRENPEIVQALAHLGKTQRLGPASNYETELRDLRDADALFRPAEGWLASAAPLYADGNRLRVPAVLNACQPVTFTWKESSEPTYITASMADAAGLVTPADAAATKVTLAGRRELTVRQVTLGTVEFGRFQLKDVSAYVLPPEGEDLGAQIGPAAFGKLHVAAEPEWLRLSVRKEE